MCYFALKHFPLCVNPIRQGGCDKNSWHPDHVYADGCSNSLNYPKAWVGAVGLFHATSEECCEYFRPNEECIIYDACEDGDEVAGPTTASVEICMSDQWHPDMTTKDGCSNSLDYPQEWEGNSMYIYKTPQECCDVFFKDKECIIHKPCKTGSETETTSCKNNKWHPDTFRGDGCSNSADYPDEWNEDSMKPFYLLDTSNECCSTFFLKEDGCTVYHDCENQPTTYIAPPATVSLCVCLLTLARF